MLVDDLVDVVVAVNFLVVVLTVLENVSVGKIDVAVVVSVFLVVNRLVVNDVFVVYSTVDVERVFVLVAHTVLVTVLPRRGEMLNANGISKNKSSLLSIVTKGRQQDARIIFCTSRALFQTFSRLA